MGSSQKEFIFCILYILFIINTHLCILKLFKTRHMSSIHSMHVICL